MNVLIGKIAVILITFRFFDDDTIHRVQGIRPYCRTDEAPPDERFSKEHYGEVGYTRDTCVELARTLIKMLELPKPTDHCLILVNNRVISQALEMMRDFNDEVSKEYGTSDLDDQYLIMRCIDIAIARLTNAGVAAESPDLIREIKRLKTTYCQEYLNHTKKIAEEQRQNQKEVWTETDADERVQKGVEESHHTSVSDAEEIEKRLETETEAEPKREVETDGLTEEEERLIEARIEYWEISEGEEEFLQDLEHEFPLHESVFQGNSRKLLFLLKQGVDVTKKDKHGNTALHLAAMLGRKDLVNLLLVKGASVTTKNLAGWNALQESISYGDRGMILSMVRIGNRQLLESMVKTREHLLPRLRDITDFYTELKFELRSWVPLSFLFLPSDLWKIKKRGSSIRMDFTLMNWWRRGDMTVLFNGVGLPKESLFILNNKRKEYVRMEHVVCFREIITQTQPVVVLDS